MQGTKTTYHDNALMNQFARLIFRELKKHSPARKGIIAISRADNGTRVVSKESPVFEY